MNWFVATFTSSIGKKLIMSLAGLFLISFLLVHLAINSFLVIFESPKLFNIAANFMATNPVIKVFEVLLGLGFALHIIYAIILQLQNWLARPSRYKVENLTSQTSFFSKWMIHTAVIILIFLVIHLMDFYFKAKFGHIGEVVYNGKTYHDMAALVTAEFHETSVIIIYIISFIFLAFHLNHAFQSAFQTLGFNHNKYTPWIKFLGTIYSIVVPLGFVLIALIVYIS